jgi:DNA repair exonuclease SbcCD ATPase subunit|nr:MAG TPA: chromosome segregation ATPase [Caudoviricetes sp.]
MITQLSDFKKINPFSQFKNNSLIPVNEIANVRQFNNLLTQGKSVAEAESIALKGCSKTTLDIARSANGAAVSEEILSASLKGVATSSKLAAVGMKALSIAGNMLTGLAISFLLDGIITLFDNIVNGADNAKESLAQFTSSFSDSIDKLDEENKSVNELVNRYVTLVATTDDLSTVKDDLNTIQDNLIDKYGNEAKSLDLLNGKMSENIKKIKEWKKEKAESELYQESDITDPDDEDRKLSIAEAYALAQKKLKEGSSFGSNGGRVGQAYVPDTLFGKYNSNADINKVGSRDYGDWGDYKEVAEILKKYNNVGMSGYDDDTLYFAGTMQERIDTMQKVYDELSEKWANISKDDNRNKWLADLQKEIATTTEEYDKLSNAVDKYNEIQKTLENYNTSEEFSKAFDEAQKATESYSHAVETKNIDDVDRLYDLTQQYKDKLINLANGDEDLIDYVNTFFETLPAKLTTDTFDISEWTDDIDEVQNKAKSLKDTLTSLQDGSISDSDLVELFKSYPDLAKFSGNTEKLTEEVKKLIRQNPKELTDRLKELSNSLPNGNDKANVEGLISSLEKLGEIASSISEVKLSVDDIEKIYEETFDDLIDKAEDEKDVLEEQKNILTEQKTQLDNIISQYETVANTVESYIDEQKSAIEDRYNAEIDAIKAVNEEKQDTIDLQEKLNNLENAKKKKVNVYSEASGWHLETNTEEVNKAQQEYEQASADKRVSDLEKQRDKETSLWDKYKQQWQDLINSSTNTENEQLAKDILGVNWTDKIAQQDTNILNDFASKYQSYRSQLSDQVEKEIESVDKEITAKSKEIEAYKKEKEALSKYVTDITNKNKDYIKQLTDVSEKEMQTMEGRTKFLEDCKKRAREALDYSDISVEGAKSNGLYLVQYDGETVGTGLDEAQAEQLKSELYGKMVSSELLANPMLGKNKGALTAILNALKSKFNIIKPYRSGGIDDYTGLAQLHGKPNAVETIFNSEQGRKLYNLVANTDNLVNYIGDKIYNGITDLVRTKMSSPNNIQNRSDTNNKTIVFQIDTVNTTDGTTFLEQMNTYLQQADLDRIVGKNY